MPAPYPLFSVSSGKERKARRNVPLRNQSSGSNPAERHFYRQIRPESGVVFHAGGWGRDPGASISSVHGEDVPGVSEMPFSSCRLANAGRTLSRVRLGMFGSLCAPFVGWAWNRLLPWYVGLVLTVICRGTSKPSSLSQADAGATS